MGRHLKLRATLTAAGAGRGEPVMGALHDQVVLDYVDNSVNGSSDLGQPVVLGMNLFDAGS